MSKESIINVLGADKIIQTNQPAEGEVLKSKKNIFLNYQCRRKLGSRILLSHFSVIIKTEFKGHFLKEAMSPSSYWRTLIFFTTFHRVIGYTGYLRKKFFLSFSYNAQLNEWHLHWAGETKELNIFLVSFLLFTSHDHQIFIPSRYFCLQSESYTEMMAIASWEI